MRAWRLVVLAALLVGSPSFAQDAPALANARDKIMYSLGVNMASNLKQQGADIDLDLVVRGMKDALAGGPLLLSDEEIRIAFQKYQVDVRQKRSQALAQTAAANSAQGAAFLEKNRTAEGVVTLPSGLQYRVLVAGGGKKPTAADSVEVVYKGKLVDGRVFDSSPRNGKPAILKLSGAVAGLAEALKLMTAGSKWELFIPASLGYGTRGKPGSVGPNATLIYELELVTVR